MPTTVMKMIKVMIRTKAIMFLNVNNVLMIST